MSEYERVVADWKTNVWRNQAIAERYQVNIYRDDFFVTLKNRREADLVCRYAHGRVLDAGCGTGRVTIPLHDAGYDVTGLDVSDEMLSVAKRVAGDRSIPFLQGSVFNLPFGSHDFDSVVSITVIAHFPQWLNIVDEYIRVLKPGGSLVVNMCSRRNVDYAARNGGTYGADTHPGDPNYFQAEVYDREVVAVLAQRGLVVKEIIPYSFFNRNPVLMDSLGTDYSAFMARLQAVFNNEDALELWDYFERFILARCPSDVSYDFMLVAQKCPEGGPSIPWREAVGGFAKKRIDADVMASWLGPEYDDFRSGLLDRLRAQGSTRLLAVLNNWLAPRLPFALDFLTLLDGDAATYVADQIVWDWAQRWSEHSAFQGVKQASDFAPIDLSHSVFTVLTQLLASKMRVG